jgi:hypothetical protein
MLTWCIACHRFLGQCRNSGGSQAKQDAFFGVGRLPSTFLGGGGHCRGATGSARCAVTLGHLGRDVNHILGRVGRVVPEPLQTPTLSRIGNNPARLGCGVR